MPQFTPQPAQKQKIIFKKKKKLWRFFSSKDLPHGTAVYALTKQNTLNIVENLYKTNIFNTFLL
jgi:hypothetical protein